MAIAQITTVARSQSNADELWGFTLDSPKPGDRSLVWALNLRGWILGKKAPVTAVECHYDGVLSRTIPVDRPRPDVAARYPQVAGAATSGFEACLGVVGLAPEFELQLCARCDDGTTIPLAAVRGVHGPLRSSFRPKIQPLMVTSLGRTGTTWLMCLLAEHPAIAVYRKFPYENTAAGYWMHMLKVLSEPANHRQSSHPESFLSKPWFVGHNPFYTQALQPQTPPSQRNLWSWLGRGYVANLASFCQRSIESYYRNVAQSGQKEIRYFAEKHQPWHVARLIWDLYPRAREIFLVRDFRDMVCSVLSFNAKRGFVAFGRERFTNDEQYIRDLRVGMLRLLESWQSRSRQAHLVRYEDLVLRPTETIKTLLDYLDLEGTPEIIDGMIERALAGTPQLAEHRTASDARASVGRWRNELEPSLQIACKETFGDVLEAFGYDDKVAREVSTPTDAAATDAAATDAAATDAAATDAAAKAPSEKDRKRGRVVEAAQFSIVLIGHAADLLNACIEAVKSAGDPRTKYEFIVIGTGAEKVPDEVRHGVTVRHCPSSATGTPAHPCMCNEAAALATGKYLAVLRKPAAFATGWLDPLLRFAEAHPQAAVVGSKQVRPPEKVVHAGVVVGRDGEPHYLYAGFPANHASVNVSRRFQIVDLEGALIRREAFEAVGGFDRTFDGIYADADLCLRLGECGYEVYYCHESILHQPGSSQASRSVGDCGQVFRKFWSARLRRDEFDYYLADGLIEVRHEDEYPLRLSFSPELAAGRENGRAASPERLAAVPARDLAELVKTTLRHCLKADENGGRIMSRFELLAGSMQGLLKDFENRRARVKEAAAPLLQDLSPLRDMVSERLIVSQPEATVDQPIMYFIEDPVPGSKWPGADVPVAGWVIGRTSPVTAVELVTPAGTCRRIRVAVSRPDIAAEYPDIPIAEKSGFETAIPLLDLFRDTQVTLHAVQEDGTRTFMATIEIFNARASELADRLKERSNEIVALETERNRLLQEVGRFQQGVSDSIVVSLPETEGERAVDFFLEAPLPGGPLESNELTVAGWVVGRTSPVVSIDLRNRGGDTRRVPVSLPRPDIAAARPDVAAAASCGFHTTLDLPDFLRNAPLLIQAVHEDGKVTAMAAVQLHSGPSTAAMPTDEMLQDIGPLRQLISDAIVVSVPDVEGEQAVDFHLEAPLSGGPLDSNELTVAGWVVGRTSPVASIELRTGAGDTRRVPVSLPRPDIAAARPDVAAAASSGFHTALNLLDFLRNAPLLIQAVHEDGKVTAMATVQLRSGPSTAAMPADELPQDIGPLRQLISDGIVVSVPEAEGEQAVDFHLEAPLPGGPLESNELTVAGWVVGRTSPVASIELRNSAGDSRRVPVSLPRPDIAAARPDVAAAASCGFHTTLDLLDFLRNAPLFIQAVHEDGQVTAMATVRLRSGPSTVAIPADELPQDIGPLRQLISDGIVVSVPEAEGEQAVDFHLEAPLPGGPLESNELTVAGWVVGRTSPVLSIELRNRGGDTWRAPVSLPRPDIAAALPDVAAAASCGFHTTLDLLDFLQNAPLLIQAVHEDGKVTAMAEVQLRSGPSAAAPPTDQLLREIGQLRQVISEGIVVSVAEAEGERVVDFYLEAPVPGGPLDSNELTVAGWAVGRTSPVVAVELLNPAGECRRIPVSLPRPDIAAALPDVAAAESGFQTTLDLPDFLRKSPLRIQAVHEDGKLTPMAAVKFRFGPSTAAMITGQLLQESQELRQIISNNVVVNRSEANGDRAVDYDVDAPVPGSPLESFDLPVAGWVVGRTSPVVAVELVSPGGERQRIPLSFSRPDVAAAHPHLPAAELSGFEATLDVVRLLRESPVLVQAVHADGSLSDLWSIGISLEQPADPAMLDDTRSEPTESAIHGNHRDS